MERGIGKGKERKRRGKFEGVSVRVSVQDYRDDHIRLHEVLLSVGG